jgi:hypothetical protein
MNEWTIEYYNNKSQQRQKWWWQQQPTKSIKRTVQSKNISKEPESTHNKPFHQYATFQAKKKALERGMDRIKTNNNNNNNSRWRQDGKNEESIDFGQKQLQKPRKSYTIIQ